MELSIEDRKFSFLNDDGIQIAEMTYSLAGEKIIIIDHTEVNDHYRGSRLGYKLLLEVIELAKNTGKKIIPLCPYAKSVFDKTDEFDSVLFKA
ncbi:MAG: GNAT family N-acetyltransferase [Clostridiaceae bacterium]